MTRLNHDMNHDAHDTPIDELELLISRMVDGEATDDDRRRFDRHAQAEPDLWRTLARRQEQMRRLTDEFEDEVAAAVDVAPPAFIRTISPVRWGIALSGWAAVIILAFVLAVVIRQSPSASHRDGQLTGSNLLPDAGVVTDDMSYEAHLQAYMQAPYVGDEMDPIVLQVDELGDGRLGIRVIRRIEEVLFIDDPAVLPVNEFGVLDVSPALIREMLKVKPVEAAAPSAVH
jgi:hypothetical protein